MVQCSTLPMYLIGFFLIKFLMLLIKKKQVKKGHLNLGYPFKRYRAMPLSYKTLVTIILMIPLALSTFSITPPVKSNYFNQLLPVPSTYL